MKRPRYILGCDESGTGAWAGPFTVCAYLAEESAGPLLFSAGARDSKQLSRRRRAKLVNELAAYSAIVGMEIVPPDYDDLKAAWRKGVLSAIRSACRFFDDGLENVEIVIDGLHDRPLSNAIRDKLGVLPTFMPRADAKVPQVSAASILAKVRRSELMHEAHQAYPHYGWSSSTRRGGNDGYGTDAHRRAIEWHGVCALHRRVTPLLPFFDGKTVGALPSR